MASRPKFYHRTSGTLVYDRVYSACTAVVVVTVFCAFFPRPVRMGVEFRRRGRRRRLVEKHAISTPHPRARRVSKVRNTLSLDSVERIFYTRIFIDCRRRFLLQQIASPASSRYPRPFSLGRSFQFQDVPRKGGRAGEVRWFYAGRAKFPAPLLPPATHHLRRIYLIGNRTQCERVSLCPLVYIRIYIIYVV